jgi:hypothetical protein
MARTQKAAFDDAKSFLEGSLKSIKQYLTASHPAGSLRFRRPGGLPPRARNSRPSSGWPRAAIAMRLAASPDMRTASCRRLAL